MIPNKKIRSDGTIQWELPNGYLHNEHGPATIRPDGTKEWCINGELHRLDGPAIVWGEHAVDEEWFFNGKLHRTDGPALNWVGRKIWASNGKCCFRCDYCIVV